MSRLLRSRRPSRHFAYQRNNTSTLSPARSATLVGSTPLFSHRLSAACRRPWQAAVGIFRHYLITAD